VSARTQDEIIARFHASDDFFGFAIEVLTESLTAESIRSINADAELPGDWKPQTGTELTEAARGYLDFAAEKALAHRGISAERSTIKLREYAWLLGRDDIVQAMDNADYPQYGVPKVKAFADGMGWTPNGLSTAEVIEFERMAQGRYCTDDCVGGCGQ